VREHRARKRAESRAACVSKQQLAARLGLDSYAYSRIENGSVRRSAAPTVTLAVLLDTDPRVLGATPCDCGCDQLAAPGRRFLPGHDNTKGEQARRVWPERRRAQGVPEVKTCQQCRKPFTRNGTRRRNAAGRFSPPPRGRQRAREPRPLPVTGLWHLVHQHGHGEDARVDEAGARVRDTAHPHGDRVSAGREAREVRRVGYRVFVERGAVCKPED
jgi:hypothetical protein